MKHLLCIAALLVSSIAAAHPTAPKEIDWDLTRAKVQAKYKGLTPDTCPEANQLCPTPGVTPVVKFRTYEAGVFYGFDGSASDSRLRTVTYVLLFDVPKLSAERSRKAFYDLNTQLGHEWGQGESADAGGDLIVKWTSYDLDAELRRSVVADVGIVTIVFKFKHK